MKLIDRPFVAKSTAAIDMVAIVCLWGASLLLVNPRGDFPLDDDWSYGMTVKRLLQDGDFRPTGFTAMPLISQAVWAPCSVCPPDFRSAHSGYLRSYCR